MRELTLRQTPARLQVRRKILLLLDRLEDSLVDLLLIRRLGFRESLLRLRLALREELGLAILRCTGRGLRKVLVVDLALNLMAVSVVVEPLSENNVP